MKIENPGYLDSFHCYIKLTLINDHWLRSWRGTAYFDNIESWATIKCKTEVIIVKIDGIQGKAYISGNEEHELAISFHGTGSLGFHA